MQDRLELPGEPTDVLVAEAGRVVMELGRPGLAGGDDRELELEGAGVAEQRGDGPATAAGLPRGGQLDPIELDRGRGRVGEIVLVAFGAGGGLAHPTEQV